MEEVDKIEATSFEHLPGQTVIILDGGYKPVGEREIKSYMHKELAYQVWWTYPQTGEKQMIQVPGWRLLKKYSSLKKSVS